MTLIKTLLLTLATPCLFAQSATEPLGLAPSHATASVANLDRATKWYEQMLGFKMVLREKLNANAEIAWMVIPGYRIDLIQRKDSIKHPLQADRMLTQGWGHVVFKVPDVDKAYAILKARGVVLPEPVTTNKQLQIRASHFPDSEGNWLEIIQDLRNPPLKY